MEQIKAFLKSVNCKRERKKSFSFASFRVQLGRTRTVSRLDLCVYVFETPRGTKIDLKFREIKGRFTPEEGKATKGERRLQ